MSKLEYGKKIYTMGELRELTADLSDNDQICIETIDLETGDTEDLYPMYVDVIEGIQLTDGSIVREIRFCQMPNTSDDIQQPESETQYIIVENLDDHQGYLGQPVTVFHKQSDGLIVEDLHGNQWCCDMEELKEI